jgi:hypothetical protein
MSMTGAISDRKMEEPFDIVLLLHMASMVACDPRHRNTLIQAKDEIERLRKEKADLLPFLRYEIRQSKTMRQGEVIGGNIVKEALWQGELTAFHKLVRFLHYRDGGDTYRELLKEI